jgi:poly-gamma-glutamate synthesis protein (capsule biosynthesis protein)
LESPFAAAGLTPVAKDGVYMSLEDSWIGALTAVPFHLATLANNHILDYGFAGLARTQSILRDNGIDFCGAGASQHEWTAPWRRKVGESELAVINVAEGEEGKAEGSGGGVAPFDVPAVCERIRSLRAENALVVVIAHAGREHLPIPAPYIRDAYRAWADAGAHLVVGHHPHVPQGMERWGGGTIYYSLGNFVMWMDSQQALHNLGICLQARFTNSALAGTEVIPFNIHPNGLTRLRAGVADLFHTQFERLSTLITEPEKLETVWAAFADRWFETSGVAEIAESAALLAGPRRMAQTLVKLMAAGSAGNGFAARLKQKLLWRLNAFLQGGVSSIPPAAERRNAAAILRNRFDTLAHRELYLLALKRVMTGEAGTTPDWAKALLDEWGSVD